MVINGKEFSRMVFSTDLEFMNLLEKERWLENGKMALLVAHYETNEWLLVYESIYLSKMLNW